MKINFNRKYVLAACGITVLFIVVFFGTYLYLSANKMFVKSNSPINAVVADDLPVAPSPSGDLSFLLLGHGGAGHSGGELVDSIILFNINTKKKTAFMVSIPRDLWIEGRKINEGYVAGGYDLLKHEVQVVTGTIPENYISIDFDNYKKMIDTFGGLDVNVPKFYEDKFYPIKGKEIETCGKSAEEFAELHKKYSGYQLETQFECRYEDLKFEPGVVHMDGELALKYVRSRHGDGDFGRSERQFVILNAVKDKLATIGSVSKVFSLVDTITDMVRTNLSKEQTKSFIGFLNEQKDYKMTSIHLTDANILQDAKSSTGQFILSPKGGFPAVVSYIKSQIK